MKNPLLLLSLILSCRLFCQETLSYNYGISFPEGIYSGINYSGEEFSTLVQFNYRDETLQLDQLYFKSNSLSFGSLSFSGLLKDMASDDLHFFSFDEIPEAEINSSGNPSSNMGLIFEMTPIDTGFSVLRQEDLSRLFLWKNIFLTGDGLISFSQSLSVDEDDNDDLESWYLNEPILKSQLQLNSMMSIIVGHEMLFGGGQLQINTSSDDPPGYSVLLLGGIYHEGVYFQNELRFSSSRFVTSDLSPYQYPFFLIGEINFLDLPIEWNSSYTFYLERENLPWENPLWGFSVESTLEYDMGLWQLDGELDLTFLNSDCEPFLMALNMTCSVRRETGSFYWKVEGEAGLDVYFLYSLSFNGGYNSPRLSIDLSSSIFIERSILADISISGTFVCGRAKILGEFILEDLGFYNCGDISLKPYFYIGIELESLLNSQP